MEYAQGDVIVHPQHGAAVVERVVTKDLGQGPVEYLELYVDFGSLRILLPSESAERVGIRSLSSKDEAEALLTLLQADCEVPTEWGERNASTVARMKSKELDQIAMVVRDLTRHQQRIAKPLNVGEQTAFNMCLGLLARELALSLDLTEDATRTLLAAKAAGRDGAPHDSHEPAHSE